MIPPQAEKEGAPSQATPSTIPNHEYSKSEMAAMRKAAARAQHSRSSTESRLMDLDTLRADLKESEVGLTHDPVRIDPNLPKRASDHWVPEDGWHRRAIGDASGLAHREPEHGFGRGWQPPMPVQIATGDMERIKRAVQARGYPLSDLDLERGDLWIAASLFRMVARAESPRQIKDARKFLARHIARLRVLKIENDRLRHEAQCRRFFDIAYAANEKYERQILSGDRRLRVRMAVEAARSPLGPGSLRAVAEKYNVPLSTLHRALSKEAP